MLTKCYKIQMFMSEAHYEQPGADESARLNAELQHVLGLKLLRHTHNLFDDALQRQILSGQRAKQDGLKFVDIYVQETATDTPLDSALTLLLTRDGDWLRPHEEQPHFYVYFPFTEGDDMHSITSLPGALRWITKVEANGNSVGYVITEEGVRRSLPAGIEVDETVNLLDVNLSLEPAEGRELLDELRTFRLAPLTHYAKESS